MDATALARALYGAYVRDGGGNGDPHRHAPAWDHLATEIRAHWTAASEEALRLLCATDRVIAPHEPTGEG